jgi:catalase-peroxidase
MAVLIGGMRALNANFGQSQYGIFTERPETLTNDFFVNLLDLNTEWKASASDSAGLESNQSGQKISGRMVDKRPSYFAAASAAS